MDKVYQVVHNYYVDGGFGDAISRSDVVAVFASEDDAKEFASRFSNPHVYDKPYADLECGTLVVVAMDVIPAGFFPADTYNMWWLDEEDDSDEVYDDYEEYYDYFDR